MNLFEQISTGSSLNPDLQDENEKIEFTGFNKEDLYIEDDNDEIEEDNEELNEDPQLKDDDSKMIIENDSYTPYDYTNTIDKIFKTEKKKRDLSDFDPRRFEDAEP